MRSKKLMIVLVTFLCFAIIATLTTTVVVLVSNGNQSATARVKVNYTAIDVEAELSANCYVGSIRHVFKTSDGISSSIVLNPDNPTGSLNQMPLDGQEVAEIALTKTNDIAVFEYIFTNKSDRINMKIGLNLPQNINGFSITYAVSDTSIVTEENKDIKSFLDGLSTSSTYGTISGDDESGTVELNANSSKDAKKYIYVIVQVSNLLKNSEFSGDFSFALTRTTTNPVS